MTAWSRRSSNFSDTDLTRFESLVLECALEDARQDGIVGPCEMSREDHDALLCLPGNRVCWDCSKKEKPEWCSVSFGIFLCSECGGVHRAMGTHISRVRSTKMDSWSDEQLKIMRKGGNKLCRDFFAKNGVDLSLPLKERYTSSAAESYKEVLKNRVSGDDDSVSSGFSGEEEQVVPIDAYNSANTPVASVSSARSSSDDSGTKRVPNTKEEKREDADDENEESTDLGKILQQGLERWLSKAPESASSALADAVSDAKNLLSTPIHSTKSDTMLGSQHHKKKITRSRSTASAPTITYLGRIFSANCEQLKGRSLYRQRTSSATSPVLSRTALAHQQERLAKSSSIDKPWRTNLPPNFWTVDKKVEPFMSSSSNGNHCNGSASDKLSFTETDLLNVATDNEEFARLKAGLKNRGAVTNEVLKQKLHAFIVKSKLRKSRSATSAEELLMRLHPLAVDDIVTTH